MMDPTRIPTERPLRWIAAAGLSLALIGATSAAADNVYLKNGQTFQDVVATETEKGVRIRVAFGEITVANSAVERIERSESALDEYLGRKMELQRSGASAGEWKELSEWALRAEVEHGAREAGMMASKLDPQLDGLGPLMRSLGYSYSEGRGEWLTGDDYMRSLGYIRLGGEWVSPEEMAERRRLAEEAQQARRDARAEAREERLAEAVELLTLAQLAELTEPPRPEPTPPVTVYTGYYTSGYAIQRRPRVSYVPSPTAPFIQGPTAEDPPYALDILVRPPGSLFPIRSHRGSLNSIQRR